jgi:hypothetical protein
MRILTITCVLLLAACGRPMTENEVAFIRTFKGDTLDYESVRIVDGAPTRAVTFEFKPRPRTTCRELIMPPRSEGTVTSKPAAVAVYNTVLFDRDWYLDDYLPDYPDRIGLIASMLFAHELTHVWQWQNRQKTGYTPWRAAFEHARNDDPYLFDLETTTRFLDFGFEQQGTIVEEYVCCRALAPDAPRTKRLHDLIGAAMPLSPLPDDRAHEVGLPWDGVDLANLCR